MSRSLPNLVICGTPGTGKSTLCTLVAQHPDLPAGMQVQVMSEAVRDFSLHNGWDEQWASWDVDEDKVLDHLEPLMKQGGSIIDWHTVDIFPASWLDLIVVLRCNHTLLWDRLEARGYTLAKIQENNQAEIMGVVLEDARAVFLDGEGGSDSDSENEDEDGKAEAEQEADQKVVQLDSENLQQMNENVERVVKWINQWISDNAQDWSEEEQAEEVQR